MSVLVTRINLKGCGLVELWVNMDECRKHIYQQMIEDIQNPERMFKGSEGKPGDFCLVCISGIWHRAWIVSLRSENYKVFLVDQGQSHVTTWESLAWGKGDSFFLPPEIESCVLANLLIVKNESKRAETFLDSLPGKTFEALVQDLLMPARIIVLEVPAVSQDLCEAGLAKKIPADEFGKLVQGSRQNNPNRSGQRRKEGRYLYPALLTNTYEYVSVTEVIDPQKLYCRLLIFSRALEMLSDEIQQHYEESSEFAEDQPGARGDPCAAKGSDGRWHRSVLKGNMAAADSVVQVLHVDEGRTEVVPVNHIKPLHESFLRMPVVTYPCCLDGVKEGETGWKNDQIDCLKSLILHQRVLATFRVHLTSKDVYRVILYANDGGCLNTCFLEKASSGADPDASDESIPSLFLNSNTQVGTKVQGAFANTESPTAKGRTDAASSNGIDGSPIKNGPDAPLHRNRRSAVFLTKETATDDGMFTVGSDIAVKVTYVESPNKFWCQTTEKSGALRRLMQNLQSRYAFGPPQPICVARSPDDGMWYRARIMASRRSPVVDVRFIDYGHVHKVPLRNVQPIDPAFLRLNAQAFQCRLVGGRSTRKPVRPAPAALQTLDDPGTSPNVELRCVVKAVTLDDEGLPLNVVDIETPSGAAKPGARNCVIEEENHEPMAPGDAYNYFTHGSEVGSKETVFGTSCKSDSQTVELFDGCENVNALIGEMMEQPKGSRAASQSGPSCLQREVGKAGGQQDSQLSDIFLLEDEKTLEAEEQHVPDGFLEEKGSPLEPGVTQASFQTCSEGNVEPGTYKQPEVSPEQTQEIFASCIVGPLYFWCQFSSTEELNSISALAQEVGQSQGDLTFSMSLDAGRPCLALFCNDNQWYRAQVMHRHGNQLHIVFIDYGNEADVEVESVRPLPRALLQRPPQAFLCSLGGFDESRGSWDDGVYDDFYHLLVDKPLKLSVVKVGKHSETALPQHLVQIECEGEDINETMKKYWTPLSKQNPPEESPEKDPLTQDGQTGSRQRDAVLYKQPAFSRNRKENVYASCIVGPCFFWCQYANTENLVKISELCQEAGQTQPDASPEAAVPGAPCLALFSTDSQWYRAQVMDKRGATLRVVFMDYGNEADVDLTSVRPLPPALLDMAPQAFLCRLNGFDESTDSWRDDVCEDFYSLLVDKPLRVTFVDAETHPEIEVPQFRVQVEFMDVMIAEWLDVNTLMERRARQTSCLAPRVQLGGDSLTRNHEQTVAQPSYD